ncbi:Speckle targeted PIP5K1A-regulated poly(A) polymerase-like [Homarus americanus]|uniref:Speckle targeted PIP5K1A-regulated poly(A) polymerase-like n=1 Tax=Homarus americanus TaxID=6706 RepID=A0A8J5MWM4_HOMAM|nr:Speckle targeted PIP5K1A-regulated poly(A) polymerase-like [Homarus americanus]
MEQNKNAVRMQDLFTCIVCNAHTLDRLGYITHILGKRHRKNLTNRNLPQANDEGSRTIQVTGFNQRTSAETMVGIFFSYGVRNITHNYNSCTIEFHTADVVKDILKKTFYQGKNRLQVTAKHSRKPSRGPDFEFVRKNIVQFLMHLFPCVFGYVFGSSANNLGFKGCDVDMYVDLGINPWAPGLSKVESECKASDITFYLSREIRQSGIGTKVQPVARARVPIVKFEDTSTRLMVDLSFRHGMPVYNTHLISQYSLAHPLVRPYLMLIRYWAKIQDVAGGGQPSYLITNYALTMLMLFNLMTRDDPIIPSVSYLKNNRGPHYNEVIIGGWDCGYNQNMEDWTSRKHNVTVMELVAEFFTYFEKLDASRWVISPLAGELIEKKLLLKGDMKSLPQCQIWYCRQKTCLQMDTALCLQDPFEHSHNCTRGLKKGPLTEFQYKCKRAAEICTNIIKGQQPLSDFLSTIEITQDVLKEICSNDSPKELDQSVEEVITLGDSDDGSQDSIKILNSSEKRNKKHTVSKTKGIPTLTKANKQKEIMAGVEDVIVVLSGESREVMTKNPDITCTSEEKPAGANGLGELKDLCDEVSLMLPESVAEKKIHKFPLEFLEIPDFNITFDGAVSGGKSVMTAADDIGQAACSIVHFTLQQCLKIDVSVIESFTGSKKRKSIIQDDDNETGKRIKGVDGESVPVVTQYHRLAQYQCVAVSQLWVGRKKISKRVPKKINFTPLQYELAVTEAQVSANEMMVNSDSTANSDKLDFMIELWQKCDEASDILVTGESRSDVKVTRGQMIPMFYYLGSLCQSLLRKVKQFVITTSSKR